MKQLTQYHPAAKILSTKTAGESHSHALMHSWPDDTNWYTTATPESNAGKEAD
jgi:hypothetical protein